MSRLRWNPLEGVKAGVCIHARTVSLYRARQKAVENGDGGYGGLLHISQLEALLVSLRFTLEMCYNIPVLR